MSSLGASLLLVDDDPLSLELLVGYLEPEGYRLTLARDGAEAWELLQDPKHKFDLVVSDRSMPNMNGMELLRQIKADPSLMQLPVIFETALTQQEDIAEGLAAGVYYYLTKPFNFPLLRTVISAALNDRIASEKLRAAVRSQATAMRMMQSGRFACRTPDEARDLASLLAATTARPEVVVLGLSELLLNGIEHGNLGMSYATKGALMLEGRFHQEVAQRLKLPESYGKVVTVDVTCDHGDVIFRITDQGHGFNHEEYMDLHPDRATDPNGRGIAMARIMSFDQLDYEGRGNIAVARVSV